MHDTCAACGRPIFTTAVRRPIVTLAQQWTHGGYGFIDRMHVPIPKNHKYQIIR